MRIGRTLPPVGYRVPLAELARSLYGSVVGSRSRDLLEQDLARRLSVREATAVSSGKAALTLILLALKTLPWLAGRRKVILPAYTCYSVPSAIVKAGLDPVPCDIARGSFDYDFDRLKPLLGSDVLGALSVHLFGIPSDTSRLIDACRINRIVVVEDAAQAMGQGPEGGWLGTTADTGFFSFGRGKNVTCGGGGVVVARSEEVAQAIRKARERVPDAAAADGLETLATMTLMAAFVDPNLYWLPAGLPFLRLGETIFHHDFPVRRLSTFQSALLSRWPEQLAWLEQVRRRHAESYLRRISGARAYGAGVPYLRFPLMLDPAVKSRLLMQDRARTLGMSGMYPSTIGRIPELQGRLAETSFPQAERVAASLVTLPTHPLLTEADSSAICDLVNQTTREAMPSARIAS